MSDLAGHSRSSQMAKFDRQTVVCSNNVSFFHRFQDITTFTVYVTATLRSRSVLIR